MKDGAYIMGDNGKMMELGGPVTVTSDCKKCPIRKECRECEIKDLTCEELYKTLKADGKPLEEAWSENISR